MKYLAIVFGLLFSVQVYAQTVFKVERVTKSKNRVQLGGDVSSILAGDILEFTDDFGEKCEAPVESVKKGRVVLDTSACANKDAILKGSEFRNIGANKAAQARVMPGNGPTLDEDWYTLWSFGFSSISYGNDGTQAVVDQLESAGSVDQSTLNYDFFGFYWPHSDKKSMSGFVISANADSFDGPGGTLTIFQYTYSYSYHQYFGANIGDQWFWRGDVGLSRVVVSLDTALLDAEEDTKMGLGILVGGGYAWPIGTDTRMQFGLYLAHRAAENDDGSKEKNTNTNFTLGFLF